MPSVARRQGGVFTAEQARAEGWTARQVRRRVEDRRWLYVAGRAMAVAPPSGEPVWTSFQWGMAAALTVPDAVVGYHTAAGIHSFPVAEDAHAHLIADARHGGVRGIKIHRVHLPPHEIEQNRSGLLVTTKQRTALDLMGVLPSDAALNLWAWVSTRSVLGLEDLRAAVVSRRNQAGVSALRELLDLVGNGAVSVAERRLHDLLNDAGVDGWDAGVTLADGDEIIAVVDVFFESARLVVEVDGFRAHSSRESFVNDRRRQNRFADYDLKLLRFTWDDLTDRPGSVVAQIQRHRHRRILPGSAPILRADPGKIR